MNILLIVVICFLAAHIVWGYYRGFLRAIYSLVSWILGIALMGFLAPMVSQAIVENTPVQEKLDVYIEEKMQEAAREKLGQQSLNPENGQSSEVTQILNDLGIPIPQSLVEQFFESGVQAEAVLEETGVYRQAAHLVSTYIIEGIVGILTLILVLILLYFGGKALDIVSHLPVIHKANEILGVIFGFAKGMLTLWIVFAAIPIFAASEFGKMILTQVNESPLLLWLYNNNPILYLLINLFS